MLRSLKSMLAATALSVAIVSLAAAQTAPPPYGTPITLEQAKKAVAAAEAEAKKNNWPVVISIVDSAGKLVLLQRLDNTQYGSIEIATGKATTAVNLRRPPEPRRRHDARWRASHHGRRQDHRRHRGVGRPGPRGRRGCQGRRRCADGKIKLHTRQRRSARQRRAEKRDLAISTPSPPARFSRWE